MLHNAQVDLNTVKANIEQAITSKLLMIGQGSGKAETHAEGFVALMAAHELVQTAIMKQQADAKATELTAKAKAKAETH